MAETDQNDPFENHKKASGWGSIWGGKNQPVKTKPEPVAAGGGKGYKADKTGHHHRPPPPSFVNLFMFPMAFFIITAVSFMSFWELNKTVPMVIALMMLCTVFDFSSLGDQVDAHGEDVNGLLPALSGPGAMRAMRVWLHVVVAWLAVFLGAVTGINADESHMSQFYAITFGQEYDDVMATTPGAAYSDAGKVAFAKSSIVEVNKSVGFKDKLVYCAAPIMDEKQGFKSVAFWAIGYDCCDPRGGFKCGHGAKGRSGVRAPPDGVFTVDHGVFLKAVNLSAAVHKLDVDEDPILLRWVADSEKEATAKFMSALGTVGLGVGLFALLVLLMTGIGLTAEHEYSQQYNHHSLMQDLQ